MTFRNGIDSLFRPPDPDFVLIDYQPYQLAHPNTHDPRILSANVKLSFGMRRRYNAIPGVRNMHGLPGGRSGLHSN